MRRQAFAISLVLTFSFAAGTTTAPAIAAGDDRAIALDLFGRGRTLLKNGNYEAALTQFEAAGKLMRTFGILLNIADCQEKLGRTASAWATWREARAVASGVHNADDEAMAAERQKELEPKLSRLTVVVPSDADVLELQIQRDGVIVPRAAWGAAIAVDPGAHVVEARAPGRKVRRLDITVEPNGDKSTATIAALDAEAPAPVAPAASAPAPLPASPPPRVDVSDSGSGQRVAGWIVGGFGLAGLGVGIGIALVGQSQHDEAVATDLAGNLQQAQDMESNANTTKIVGYAILGGGGAFLVSSVILLLTAHSPSSANVSLRPWVSSAGTGGAVFSKEW